MNFYRDYLMVNKLVAAFDRFFGEPVDSRSLNLFRALYCGMLVCTHLPQMSRAESLYKSYFSVYFPTPLFEWLGLGQLPLSVVRLSGVLLLIALLSAACGLFTRLALTLAWISFFLFYGTVLGFEKPEPHAISLYTYHYNNIVLFVLFILSVSPGVSLWGIDGLRRRGWGWQSRSASPPAVLSVPAWPTRLIKLILALAYFGSGATKLKTSGILWADGYTLQAYFLMKHLEEEAWAGYWIAQYYWVCVALSACTLILELTFIVVPFLSNRHPLMWFYVAAGLGLHIAIAVTMKIIHFLPFMGLTYLIFLDWPIFARLIGLVYPRPVREQESPGSMRVWDCFSMSSNEKGWPWQIRFSRYFIVGLLSILIFCIVFHVEVWPFSDYGVFRRRSHYRRVKVGQIRGIDRENNIHWLRAQDLGDGFNGWYDGTNFERFYVAHIKQTSVNMPSWEGFIRNEAFMRVGPDLLRDFHQHLPSPLREQLPTLEFVIRSVRRGADGWLVPSDTVLISTKMQ